NWAASVDVPTAIANGGTAFRFQTTDWIDATQWISENTEEDAVIAAWWDYGYWITTLGQRTTVADNATLNQTRIESVAKMFIAEEQSGIKIAQDLQADYVLVYVVGQKQFDGNLGNTTQKVPVFTLGQGGEESKKQWIIRIAGFDETRYLERDSFTPKAPFWQSTLLGKLIPFEPAHYASFEGGQFRPETSYQPGLVQLVTKNVKYSENGPADAPFHLVYASPSFEENKDIVTGVLIYKVNHDYVPTPEGDPYAPTTGPLADMTTASEIAEIETAQGTFKVEFFSKAAPRTVNNFMKLADEGFYDNIVFHRLNPQNVPVIQGGDPQTRNATADRASWGTGGSDETIPAEFNDIPHKRGVLSMARTSDPNSASSQFFVMLDDVSFLDGQYTVFGRVIEGMDVVDKIG
ncbi:MAG: peptidylprolyl isomerase, partial [Nitrososphaera sp.]|uniref:peptidylprolyl isomerase n=1 Tax=Nitrososphaera sp. TaxID=1971748 RepID=UPI003D700948